MFKLIIYINHTKMNVQSASIQLLFVYKVKQVYYFTDTRLLITKGYENKSNKKTHHIKLEMLWDLPIPAFAYEVGIFIEPDPDRYNSPRGEKIQRYKTDVSCHHRGDP